MSGLGEQKYTRLNVPQLAAEQSLLNVFSFSPFKQPTFIHTEFIKIIIIIIINMDLAKLAYANWKEGEGR